MSIVKVLVFRYVDGIGIFAYDIHVDFDIVNVRNECEINNIRQRLILNSHPDFKKYQKNGLVIVP